MTHLDVSPAMLAALESALPADHSLRHDVAWARDPAGVYVASGALARIAAFWSERGLVTAESITIAQCDELQRAGLLGQQGAFVVMLALQGIDSARRECAEAWNKRAVSR